MGCRSPRPPVLRYSGTPVLWEWSGPTYNNSVHSAPSTRQASFVLLQRQKRGERKSDCGPFSPFPFLPNLPVGGCESEIFSSSLAELTEIHLAGAK